MSEARCGYVFNRGTPLVEHREACCFRVVVDGEDRCRWHLDADKGDLLVAPLVVGPDEYLAESIFRGASLAGEEALAGRTLQNSDFREADLKYADLSDADLSDADFRDADLLGANLVGANLRNANLEGADLSEADLTDVDAWGASFESANLENSGMVRANLRNASIEDARLYEVAFSDTWINEGTTLGDRSVYETEADVLDEELVLEDAEDIRPERSRAVRRNEAAAWTYRALERLCRENSLPGRTRWYYVREKEARRKQAWATGEYKDAVKAEASRWVMEHGSNPWRIIGVSALVILVWAFLYPLTGGLFDAAAEQTFGFYVETPTDAPRYYFGTVYLKSLYFSVVTFATLGYGDIQPIGGMARALAMTETLLGSLLTALLVFVLARIVTW